jgi:hypothetical protein
MWQAAPEEVVLDGDRLLRRGKTSATGSLRAMRDGAASSWASQTSVRMMSSATEGLSRMLSSLSFYRWHQFDGSERYRVDDAHEDS